MGFPDELGHFSSLAFIGFGFQEHFPFTPRVTIVGGGFNLSQNLKVEINYEADLMALYTYSWLCVKEALDPESIDKAQLNAWGNRVIRNQFNPSIKISCKNSLENKICKKMGIKCVALTEEGLCFSKCPIIIEEARKVFLNNTDSREF